MYIRITGICAIVCSILILSNGCGQSGGNGSQTAAAQKQPSPNTPIATIHWLGLDRLAKESNAAAFLKIWRLPESEKLKAQTLDKLALAPWRLSATNHPPAVTNYAALVRGNHSASLIRPLLDDLVKNEWYLEIRDAKTASAQLGLAIRLDAKHASAWETNLSAVFATLPGARLTSTQFTGDARGWLSQATNSSAALPPYLRRVELAHTGTWTLLGMAPEQNSVFAELLARVQRTQTPSAKPATNDWLETSLDLRRLSTAFSWDWDLSPGWPEISLDLNGNGERVLTRGHLDFPNGIPFKVEPWLIPTNLIHEPIQSFTALQGIKPWLSSLDWWKNLRTENTPNQLFCWAQSGSPFLEYAAAPVPHADSIMTKLGPQIMQSFNPVLTSNRMGSWERATTSDGVAWRGPIMSPFVQSTRLGNEMFLFAGISPYVLSNSPSPAVTLKELLGETNVVYFDREITGPRVEAWMFISQLSRLILRRAQLPSDCAAITWFRAMGGLLAPSTTTAKQTGSSILISRVSTVGLTAAELHILADWLESPEFPAHLHTSVAKLNPLPPRPPKAQTTSAK